MGEDIINNTQKKRKGEEDQIQLGEITGKKKAARTQTHRTSQEADIHKHRHRMRARMGTLQSSPRESENSRAEKNGGVLTRPQNAVARLMVCRVLAAKGYKQDRGRK